MKTNDKKTINVIGCGYVGLSLAILFSLKNKVFAIDINKDRINNINNRINYIKDDLIDEYFKTKELNLIGTNDYNKSISVSDFVIICVPTNYNKKTDSLDTSIIENEIEKILKINSKITIIIKSTIPLGFTKKMQEKYSKDDIIFCPEFLREGNAFISLLCNHPRLNILSNTIFRISSVLSFLTVLFFYQHHIIQIMILLNLLQK